MVSSLTAIGISSTSIKVSWDLPQYPNGQITGYVVYYLKVSDDTAGIESDPEAVSQNPSNIDISRHKRMPANTTETVIEGLEVYRYYSIVVRAVGKDASKKELNGTLREVVERTFSDFPTERPQVIGPEGNSQNTITITLPNHDYIDSGQVV